MMFTIHRYTQNDTAATLLETFKSFENFGVRWSVPGGLQRVEVTIPVKNKFELYGRMNTHPGQRIGIYSSKMTRPITGWIYEVNSVGEGLVQYVLFGGWRRLKDVYDTTVYAPTDTNGEVVAATLDNYCLFYNGDDTYIETGGSEIAGWTVAEVTGSTLQDVILDMGDLSDSSYNRYDFWFTDERVSGNRLRQLVPYFQPRSETAAITWQVDIGELGGLDTSRGIAETFSSVTVFYDTLGGTATSGNATTLNDTTASFLSDGLTEGDRVANNDDGSFARIVTIDSNTKLTISTLTGGTANVFAASDSYTITLQNLQSVTASDTPVNNIWVKYLRDIKYGLDVTQATRYANMVLAQSNEYKQQSPFTINSRTIRDVAGGRWPLLEMIARGGGYLRINDLYPSGKAYTQSSNNSTTFFITSLDYDNVSGQMRVTVDSPDSRIDVRLLTAGILNSEMVGRK